MLNILLRYGYVVGKRRDYTENIEPGNISDISIATALIWLGWFGFNGGSELAVNSRAVNALIVTHLAACVGGIAWITTEMILNRNKKMSLYGFCNGTMAGMVGITPGCGFVTPKYSIIIGIISRIVQF